MFSDTVEQQDLPNHDPEYLDLLRRVLAIQADCEIGGPHLYVDAMLPSAPTQIDQLVVARTAAEEIDHFRKFARLAGDIGVDTAYILGRKNQERYLEAFRGTITTWEDFAVFGFLIDRVGRYQLEEFAGCSYAPLSRLLEQPSRVLDEEAGHIDFGTTRTAEMAAKGGEQKDRVRYVRPIGVDSRRALPPVGPQAAHQRRGACAIHRRGQSAHRGHGPRG